MSRPIPRRWGLRPAWSRCRRSTMARPGISARSRRARPRRPAGPGAEGGRGGTGRLAAVDALELLDCGMLKVDVEGWEVGVLRGAMATIGRCRPILYVENDRAA